MMYENPMSSYPPTNDCRSPSPIAPRPPSGQRNNGVLHKRDKDSPKLIRRMSNSSNVEDMDNFDRYSNRTKEEYNGTTSPEYENRMCFPDIVADVSKTKLKKQQGPLVIVDPSMNIGSPIEKFRRSCSFPFEGVDGKIERIEWRRGSSPSDEEGNSDSIKGYKNGAMRPLSASPKYQRRKLTPKAYALKESSLATVSRSMADIEESDSDTRSESDLSTYELQEWMKEAQMNPVDSDSMYPNPSEGETAESDQSDMERVSTSIRHIPQPPPSDGVIRKTSYTRKLRNSLQMTHDQERRPSRGIQDQLRRPSRDATEPERRTSRDTHDAQRRPSKGVSEPERRTSETQRRPSRIITEPERRPSRGIQDPLRRPSRGMEESKRRPSRGMEELQRRTSKGMEELHRRTSKNISEAERRPSEPILGDHNLLIFVTPDEKNNEELEVRSPSPDILLRKTSLIRRRNSSTTESIERSPTTRRKVSFKTSPTEESSIQARKKSLPFIIDRNTLQISENPALVKTSTINTELSNNTYEQNERNRKSVDEDPGLKYADTETSGLKYADTDTPGLKYADNETPGLKYADNETSGLKYADNETPGLKYANSETPGLKYAETETPGLKYANNETPVLECADYETNGLKYADNETPASKNAEDANVPSNLSSADINTQSRKTSVPLTNDHEELGLNQTIDESTSIEMNSNPSITKTNKKSRKTSVILKNHLEELGINQDINKWSQNDINIGTSIDNDKSIDSDIKIPNGTNMDNDNKETTSNSNEETKNKVRRRSSPTILRRKSNPIGNDDYQQNSVNDLDVRGQIRKRSTPVMMNINGNLEKENNSRRQSTTNISNDNSTSNSQYCLALMKPLGERRKSILKGGNAMALNDKRLSVVQMRDNDSSSLRRASRKESTINQSNQRRVSNYELTRKISTSKRTQNTEQSNSKRRFSVAIDKRERKSSNTKTLMRRNSTNTFNRETLNDTRNKDVSNKTLNLLQRSQQLAKSMASYKKPELPSSAESDGVEAKRTIPDNVIVTKDEQYDAGSECESDYESEDSDDKYYDSYIAARSDDGSDGC